VARAATIAGEHTVAGARQAGIDADDDHGG
jgi:hypothetical protein